MNIKTVDLLGGRNAEQFLREYWQKKPLLIRNALPGVDDLLEPDEVAGLALEEEIESRIVIERSPVDWELRHGPFTEKTFENLPPSHWVLQVQALNHYCPPVSDLYDLFSFLPEWLGDDIMATCAPAGGSLGPHADPADLFLIQTHGQSRWQTAPANMPDGPLLPNLPVPVLKDFQAEQEWVLNSGDMLYLPGGLARQGVALDDGMTFTVVFRAPAEQDMLLEFAHRQAEQAPDSRLFQEPDLQTQANPGWISPHSAEKMAESLRNLLSDPVRISQLMASWLSQTKYDRAPEPPESVYSETDVAELLQANQGIRREEATRMVYTGDAHRPEHFFINGNELIIPPLTHSLVLYLCKRRLYRPATLAVFCRTPECLQLVTLLLNQGILYFEDDLYRDELHDDDD